MTNANSFSKNIATTESTTTSPSITSGELERLVERAIANYFSACRARIPEFVRAHFRYPGAWQTNRVAFGFDLLRAPLNLFWAPVYALLCVLGYLSRRKGWRKLANLLEKIPDGLTTRVQMVLAQKIYSELLKLDCEHNDLNAHITNALQQRFDAQHPSITEQRYFATRVEAIVTEALVQYRITRTASSDITNTLASTLIGAFAFNKFTPGGLGIGFLIATLVARYHAEQSFFLGETLGKIYYHMFPPEPSLQLTLWSLTGVLVILAIFASFSGLLTDPVQSLFGLHKRRLRRMIDHLENDFRAETQSSFRPKDQYLARILDLFDAVKSHIS